MALFSARVEAGGAFARDALECLDAMIEHPPPELVDWMFQYGWLALCHGDDTPFSFEECRQWLKTEVARLHSAYDELKSNSR